MSYAEYSKQEILDDLIVFEKREREWKKFWSWLLMSASGEDVYWSDTTLMGWLQAKEAEYKLRGSASLPSSDETGDK